VDGTERAWESLGESERVLAEHLLDSDELIGAAKAHRFLSARGFELSQATTSRSLLRLDELGITERIGSAGRRLRPEARRFLERRAAHQRRNTLVERMAESGDRTLLLDLLRLRRQIETEAVTLVVARASDEELARIDATVASYDRHFREHGDFSADAIAFHLLICRSARSLPYELIADALFAEIDRLEPILVQASARASATGRSNEEHAAIAAALRARDAGAGTRLVRGHFDTMISWLEALSDTEFRDVNARFRDTVTAE
jgi:DNA-binding FadR family transcriptional regulator